MDDENGRYWVIGEDEFREALARVAAGEDPDVVYLEYYANTDEASVGRVNRFAGNFAVGVGLLCLVVIIVIVGSQILWG